jgi:cytochrome P450
LAIEIIGLVTFKKKFNTFTDDSNSNFGSLVMIMLNFIQDNIYNPFSHYERSNSKKTRELNESIQKLSKIGYDLMTNLNDENCLASKLIQSHPDMEMENVQALLMDLLGAGHDTTANLINFTIGSLLENEDILKSKELENEVNYVSTFIPQSLESEANCQLNKEEIINLINVAETKTPYLSSIIKESLRLYPLGAAFSR